MAFLFMSIYSLENEKQQVYVLGPANLSTLMCPGCIGAWLSDSEICSHAAGQHRVDYSRLQNSV